MASRRRDIGAEILAGLRELKRGEVGRVVNIPDVAETRQKTGLSQARFAQLLGVSVRTLQDWEQGRRPPSEPSDSFQKWPTDSGRKRPNRSKIARLWQFGLCVVARVE